MYSFYLAHQPCTWPSNHVLMFSQHLPMMAPSICPLMDLQDTDYSPFLQLFADEFWHPRGTLFSSLLHHPVQRVATDAHVHYAIYCVGPGKFMAGLFWYLNRKYALSQGHIQILFLY